MIPHILTVGHACLDIVHRVPRLPIADEKISSTDMDMQIGGSAGNTAAALVLLGANADLCTVLGNPTRLTTHMLVTLLQEQGIGLDCTYIDRVACPVSTIFVVPNGDNAITSYQPSAVCEAVHTPKDITRYDAVLGDTYRLPMVRAVFDAARSVNKLTMLDVDTAVDNLSDLPQADHVWFSHAAWSSLDASDRDLAKLQSHFGGVVGVTNGPDAVRWIDINKHQLEHLPPQTDVSSTLGAGDVFRAALALETCRGHVLADAVATACTAASQHISNTPFTRI
jgi:sulfofructose kinase